MYRTKKPEAMKYLQKTNEVLRSADITKGFFVDMDFTQLEVKEIDGL